MRNMWQLYPALSDSLSKTFLNSTFAGKKNAYRILPSRPLDVYQNLKFNLSLQTFLNFSPFLDFGFFVSQKEWYEKCWIFNMSTASAIARMSSSSSGRNTMTSSNLTRNMTPLWLWQDMKSAFFQCKKLLVKHPLRKQPVEEFWSEETLHLLKQLEVRCKVTCKNINDNAMLGIWRSHCSHSSFFITPLWSFVKFMHLSVQ